MGYHAKPELVEEWREQLEAARVAVETGEPVTLKTNDPSRDQYRFRRALKATELFRTECGGRFAGLGALVTLRAVAGGLEIVPKASGKQALTSERPTEFDAIEKLKNYSGSGPIVEFWPSDMFDEESFKADVQALGYEMVTLQEGLEDDGALRVGALRKEKKKNPWDLIGGE